MIPLSRAKYLDEIVTPVFWSSSISSSKDDSRKLLRSERKSVEAPASLGRLAAPSSMSLLSLLLSFLSLNSGPNRSLRGPLDSAFKGDFRSHTFLLGCRVLPELGGRLLFFNWIFPKLVGVLRGDFLEAGAGEVRSGHNILFAKDYKLF